MNIITAYQDYNPCFLRGAAASDSVKPPRKIVLHLTPIQSRFARSLIDRKHKGLNAPKVQGLPHILIGCGNCGAIRAFNTLPYEWDSDCCGEGELGTFDTGDLRSIQIAICRDRTGSYRYFKAAITLAVDICVELIERYHLNNTDIISHKEAYSMWKADRASQPDDWLRKWGFTMDDFRKWVRYRVESDEDFLPEEMEEVTTHYIVCMDKLKDGKYEGVQAEYISLERAIHYCPLGFRVFSLDTGKLVYSKCFDPGAKVRVLKNVVFGQIRTFKVEHEEYEVLSANNRRIIIGYDGQQIAAVDKANLELILR